MKASGSVDEAVLGPGEVDEVLGEPRQVRLQLRAAEDELHREVPVHDRVEGVLGDGGEAEVAGHGLAVEGERRPGEGARAEGQDVHPRPRVAQALVVAHEAPRVGGRPVAERDRLGRARVRVAGHDGIGALPALRDEGVHQGDDRRRAAGRSSRASRAAAPSPSARSGCGRGAPGRRGPRRSRPAAPRRSCARPRGRRPCRRGPPPPSPGPGRGRAPASAASSGRMAPHRASARTHARDAAISSRTRRRSKGKDLLNSQKTASGAAS